MPVEPDVLLGDFTVKVSQNLILLAGHGLLDGDQVRFEPFSPPSDVLPTPLTTGTWYYVINQAPNQFQVSLTLGGANIVISDVGTGTNQAWKQGLTITFYQYMIVQQGAIYGERCVALNTAIAEGWELVQWTEPYFLVRRMST